MVGESRGRLRRWRVIMPACFAALAWGATGETQAMGKMCMFSAVQGVVTEHGKPVAGVEVERRFTWAWKNETGVDRARTDAEGRFSFGPVWRGSLLGGLLPHEPSVEQEIRIQHGDKSVVAWQFTRDSYKDEAELFGRPIRLRCDLANEAHAHRLEHNYVRHSIYGVCDLEGVQDMEGGAQ